MGALEEVAGVVAAAGTESPPPSLAERSSPISTVWVSAVSVSVPVALAVGGVAGAMVSVGTELSASSRWHPEPITALVAIAKIRSFLVTSTSGFLLLHPMQNP